jgi:8-oxo-dGTP diphosphatase
MRPLPQIASAAVAIIQCHHEQDSILLLRRAADPRDPWSGHYSFPGGRKDHEDIDIFATCRRETLEETGITLKPEHLVDSLPLEPAGRNFNTPLWVQPFLFCLPQQPSVVLNEREIQHCCWLDMMAFRRLGNHRQVEMLPGRIFPAFPLQDYYIWGFTYRLLCQVVGMEIS